MSQCICNLVQLHRPVNIYILSNIAEKTRERCTALSVNEL